MDLYNTRDRTQDTQDVKTKSKILQDIQDPRSHQDFQDPRSCQDNQDQIQDLTKKFKMSRQNLRSWQDIQEFKIFPRSWQDIQDPRSYQDFQDPISCQDNQDQIQDLTKKFKMSRQNLRSWQDIQEFKIFPRSWQDIQDPRSYQDFQDPISCQDNQDQIQDLTKKFKMSRQNLRSWQDIQEFKIFPRSWQYIQDVKRWVLSFSFLNRHLV